MTYVYVLTSTPQDLYYEQCLMSVFSLRLYMPNAKVVILTDNKTNATFIEKRAELKKIATEIISVDFDDSVGNVERSRIIKTSIPRFIHDDFLYIDCDTVICAPLDEIQKNEISFGAVLDGHVPLNEHKHKDYFLKREKRLGFEGTKKNGFHVNSGVLFFRDCEESRNLFEKWHELWEWGFKTKKDHHDQAALNEAIYRLHLKNFLLSGEWNCQLNNGGLMFLKGAKIIHYFSSEFGEKNYLPYYKLADKTLQQKIKETGVITEEIVQMLQDAKFQLTGVQLVDDKRVAAILKSPLLSALAQLKQSHPVVFNNLEVFYEFCFQIRVKLRNIVSRKKG